MIIDNEIKFGYGDILVSHDSFERCIVLKYIKPPQEIGEEFIKEKYPNIEVIKTIKIYENEPLSIYDTILKVKKYNPIVYVTCAKTGKKYILNFENWNVKSLEIVRNHAFEMIDLRFLAF